MITILIFSLAAFLFGYLLGKRLGFESGFQEGRALIPLLLRQQSYEQGYCSLCCQNGPEHDKPSHKALSADR